MFRKSGSINKKLLSGESGASLVEAAISIPISIISLFAAFAIANMFFLGSKMVHLSTLAAISLKATTDPGLPIALAPANPTLLVYTPTNQQGVTMEQAHWYTLPNTGFDHTNSSHAQLANIFGGLVRSTFPGALFPPRTVNTTVNYNGALELKLSNSTLADGTDVTSVNLRTTPVFFNMLGRLLKVAPSSATSPLLVRNEVRVYNVAAAAGSSSGHLGHTGVLRGASLGFTADRAYGLSGTQADGAIPNDLRQYDDDGTTIEHVVPPSGP